MYVAPRAQSSQANLMEAILDLASTLDLSKVLDHFVAQACHLTQARYGALTVLDVRGETASFVQYGMTKDLQHAVGAPPLGRGLIGNIPIRGALIVNDLHHAPDFTGFPPGHPDMSSFLGVPLRIREQVYGRLYLCDKPTPFTEEDAHILIGLAGAAAVAIENSRLYAEARKREAWLKVSQQLTTNLLKDSDEEEALELIARLVREVAQADASLIILPSVGDTYACEIADGQGAEDLIGLVFPDDGRAMTVLREGVGLIVDSLQRSPTMRLPAFRAYGPALYAPLIGHGTSKGVLVLLRRPDKPEFLPEDLPAAEGVAIQAALALEISASRHAEDLATLREQRIRIGRDLHDLAIQQLFATGMHLEGVRQQLHSEALDAQLIDQTLKTALNLVDDSVTQIRAIIADLRDSDDEEGLVERVRRETSTARSSLGYAPSLLVEVDGVPLSLDDEDSSAMDTLDSFVDSDISTDCVAVVREGLANAARHAHATAVLVKLALTTPQGDDAKGRLLVSVSDDGLGIDPHISRRSGLDNMCARANRHGGMCSVVPGEQGVGTLMTWSVPLG
ncbi:MAG: GAF domain-containing protein [Actinomycetaceae bacterium]|nr:GAF domain-containing protein [Actinomycetaceae bacterium]